MALPPTLAVVITYYEEGTLLTECLESLLWQTNVPEEVIVYDDASTTPAKDYLGKFSTVRILRGDRNVGPSVGRNRLLAETRSEFIHFHDCDDLFAPTWCTRIRGAMQTPDVDAIFAEMISTKNDLPHGDRFLNLRGLVQEPDLLRFCLRGPILPSAATYRTERVREIGGYRENLWQSEDYDFHVRLALRNVKYHVILDPLVTKRVRSNSRSEQQAEVWSSLWQALELLEPHIPSGYRNVLAERAAEVGSKLFALGNRDLARLAFQRAQAWGSPQFANRSLSYRWLAKALGPYHAERIALLAQRRR